MPNPASRPGAEPSHLKTVLQAVFVTFLWSTSWVLIKHGLVELPPLLFAGLRYLLAAMLLLAFTLRRETARRELATLDRRSWVLLGALGLVMYTLTQGAQFVALGWAPAVTVSLALGFTPVAVAVASIWTLRESPTAHQWIGTLTLLAGAILYTGPAGLPRDQWLGATVALFGMLANATAALFGRYVNRSGRHSPLIVTTVSMSVGAFCLVIAGLFFEDLPRLDLRALGIIAWLAIVNTAFAFTLWNHTLRRLTANESSVINNTMLIQIALLAWAFLGEELTPRQVAAVAVAALGALTVQLGRHPRKGLGGK